MSHDRSIFSLLNLVESVDEITTNAVACRVGRCEMTAWNRGIMLRIEILLKHAKSEFAKLMNDCRPVNLLPPEILTHIFSFGGRGASAMNVSHVCKWWRQIAIASPSLWSLYDPSQKLTCPDLVLHRSKRVLLDVRAHSLTFSNMKGLSPLRYQVHRLRTLDVVFNLPQWSTEASSLFELFPSSAIYLTRLSLGTINRSRQHASCEITDSSRFALLFGGGMPSLKILRLNGIRIWPQFSGPTLQSLILVNSAVPLLYLISALQAVPNLEVLVLDELTFCYDPTSYGPQRSITMQRLRILRINARPQIARDCAHLHYFLSSLSVPEGAVVSVDIWDRGSCKTGWAQQTYNLKLADYVIDNVRAIYFDDELTISDNRSCLRYISDRLFLEGISNVSITADEVLVLNFFHCKLSCVTHFEWAPLPGSGLGTLDLSMIFTAMSSLESLLVVEHEYEYGRRLRGAKPLLDALLQVEPITHIPCCALRLRKISIKFAEYSTSFGTFTNLLSTRYASGYPIKEVEIVGCEVVASEWVQQMKEYVSDIHLIKDLTPSSREERISKQLLEVESNRIYSEYFNY